MRVLVLFEMSGRVREAFKNKGHYAISVDLLDTLIPGEHLKMNIFDLDLDYIKTFDIVIAFPPCTYFSQAGNRWFKTDPTRYKKLDDSIKLIHYIWNLPVKKICMENPATGTMKKYLPISQDIQPYWFGEEYEKRTGLWLKGLPLLFPTHINLNYIHSWTQYHSHGSKNRSLTPYGLAQAMADQWG